MKQTRTIKQIIDHYQLRPQKKLGQNFLLDDSLFAKIISFADIHFSDIVLEIGPGPGGLTKQILQQAPEHLYAVEYDPRCASALKEVFADEPLTILHEDALRFQLDQLPAEQVKIIANLPYNISTVLLTNWLHQAKKLSKMVLMFQKEVAQRIIAEPGTKAYGRLSIISQYACEVEHGFDISPKAFYPPPKITSTVLEFQPKPEIVNADDFEQTISALESVTKAAFGQRRKMLKKSLQSIFEDPISILRACDIDETRRAETLSLDEFIRLTKKSLA